MELSNAMMADMDFCLVIVFALMQVSVGLKCYTCTFQYPGAPRDHACIDKPWNVTQGQKVMDCPYPYCVIFRQYRQATNQIYSFHRGCEQKSRGNTCVLDVYYSTCSYTCTTDFCNSGDGIPVGQEVDQEYIGPPAYAPPKRGKTNRKTATKEPKNQKRKRKKTPKQITCLNPYTCDQSQFWPKNDALSVQLGDVTVGYRASLLSLSFIFLGQLAKYLIW